MSRSACVIHISAVTLAQMTRNAPSVVRKIYRPMDPIRLTRPRSRQTVGAPGPRCPQRRADAKPAPFYPLFDRATKWLGQGKAFEYAQQNVNLVRVSRRPQGAGEPRPLRALTGRPERRRLGITRTDARSRAIHPRASAPSALQAGCKPRPFHVLARVLADKFAQSGQA